MAVSASRKLQIEYQAEDILNEIYENPFSITPPINLSKILEIHDLELKTYDFTDNTIVGAYSRVQKTIVIDSKDPFSRQIITIAHGIGHYILHTDIHEELLARKTIMFLTDNEENDIETEANWFATCILIPRKQLNNITRVTHDIKQIAGIFGISEAATFWRMKELNILQTSS